MNKIPVFATAGRGLRFAFGRFGTVFKIAWFPMVLIVLASVVVPILLGMDLQPRPGRIPGPEFFAFTLVVNLVALVLTSIVTIGLHRVILFGDDGGPSPVYFRLTADEWKLFGAQILIFLVILLNLIVAVIAAGLVLALTGAFPDRAALEAGDINPVAVIVFIGFVLFAVYVSLRFVLMAPVVAAEHRLSLARAWDLSKGNALRLFAALVLAALPLILLVAVGMGIVAAAFMAGGPHMMMTPPASFPEMMASPGFVVLIVVQVLAQMLGYGVAVGVLSYSYKAILGVPPDAPVGQA